ncbi:MAG: prenyltransferase/squalene oxidase repeat-containing protein, partial [Chloroflexota bacterium]
MTQLPALPGRRLIGLGLLLVLLLPAMIFSSISAQTGDEPVDRALSWLNDQQLENGGFPGFEGEADLSATTDVVMAYAAAGRDPGTVTSSGGASPIDFLGASAGDAAESTGQAAKLTLALHAANVDVTTIEPNPVDSMLNSYDADAGVYDRSLYNHALAILALAAIGEEIEPAAIDYVVASQIEDGSWSFAGEGEPGDGDSNTTSIVIQALAAAGEGDDAIAAGLDYLYSVQAEDGSFAYDMSEEPDLVGDANSTALAVQALIAADEDPAATPMGDALASLESFQNPSGAFFWRADAGTEDNLLATVQAIPALLGAPLPIEPVAAGPQEPAGELEAAMQPAEPIADCTYFEETSHNLCDNFEIYWQENGGLKIFGYPLTEPFEDGDATVQYFERARL